MKITIECEPKEIAAVVVELQKQPRTENILVPINIKFAEVFGDLKREGEHNPFNT